MASAHAGYSSDATSHGIRPPVPARSSATDARVRSAEEQPKAYKLVDDVVDVVHEAGLSTKVARMRPIGVIKG